MLTRSLPAAAPPADPPADPPRGGVRVVALTTGEQRFVYLFREHRAAECLARVAAHAADPELSLTAADAALLSERIRDPA